MKLIDNVLRDWRISKTKKFIPKHAIILDIGAFDGMLFKKNAKKMSLGIGIEPLIKEKIVGDNYTIYPGMFPEFMPENVDFDVITMLAVFEHVPKDKQQVVAESCFKLLKKGGVVIITVPSAIVDKILDILMFLKLADGMSTDEHYGFEPEDTLKIFCKPNFKLVNKSKFQLGVNNLFVFEKL